jgi:outer membrane protein assembly factor BamB
VFAGSIACRPSGDDGGVRALDGATGQLLWYSHSLGIGNGTEDAGNVAATDGAVYFSGYANAVYGGDNALLSLDARTGAVRWQRAGVFGDPAVAGGRVLVAPAGSFRPDRPQPGRCCGAGPAGPAWDRPR